MELTIAIPTFKRSEYLANLLESLSFPRQGKFQNVEIWVCDNASCDDTESVCKRSAINTDLRVNYYSHAINIGANQNIAFASCVGSGRFIWVLGDDDVVPDGALFKILNYLSLDVDFLMLNHAIYDREMLRIKVARWNRFRTDVFIKGRSEAMRLLGPMPTFISAVVARRGILDSLPPHQVVEYSAFGFNQLYAFYTGIPTDAAGVATAECLVHARGDNSGAGYNWNHYFVTGLGKVFSDLEHRAGYAAKDVRKALVAVIFRYHLKRILNEKAEGRDCRELRSLAYEAFSRVPYFWLILLPATFIPAWILGPVKKMKRCLRG